MADSAKTIENILAALAQRPPAASNSTTPNQGQPPYAVPGYPQSSTPTAYPPTMAPGSQPPAYGSGNYPLPQPSASGNFDLSGIKPVSSGSVSITDAIAQAKAYATEKGLSSYERPPPGAYGASAGPGSHAGHYRSRSRSPSARHDAYRENFNHYRDERRDDRGSHGRDYGRDRSMSPHRQRDFSPRGAHGRDRDGGGDSEVMQIEASLVGLIIGRQGENLRRVEGDTGCRVQFIQASDNQAAFRDCRISGPPAGRAEARAAINRIIEDSGMGAIARAGLDKPPQGAAPRPTGLRDGEDCMQIMVPDRTVGLIIGRGGETIRDLQERSGCHINIVGENKSVNGLRPVNLIGPRDAAAQAKDFILEIVDSDNRNANEGGMGGLPGAAPGGFTGGGGGGGGAAAGGPPKARAPRNDFNNRDDGFGGSQGKINDSMYVPSDAVGMIIGKGGETIREMQNTTGCKINVSSGSPGESQREIGLVGTREAIDRAKDAIEDKVEAVRQKNSAGGGRGGGGGRHQNRRDYDNPNQYNNTGSDNQPAAAAAHPPGAANGAADPYAPYGGYQNYLAMWYQYAQQQQGGADGKPPGA